MLSQDFHLSDQELLMAADGELQARRAAQVRSHLAACRRCRTRMGELEATIADFSGAYHQTFDAHLPSIAGPRAQLRAQLGELAAKSKGGKWRRFLQFSSAVPAAVFLGAAIFIAAFAVNVLMQHSKSLGGNLAGVSFERGAIPDRRLTPGATRAVTIGDVCSMAHEEVIREVPTSLRQKILQEYGIVNARAEDYEIDYLIAPGLGGADDIHNLWPEPYKSATWNAHVKDDLEERLHQMVCAGKVDLSTAQNEIATDWIAAYKKYFRTDTPLSPRSNVNLLLTRLPSS